MGRTYAHPRRTRPPRPPRPRSKPTPAGPTPTRPADPQEHQAGRADRRRSRRDLRKHDTPLLQRPATNPPLPPPPKPRPGRPDDEPPPFSDLDGRHHQHAGPRQHPGRRAPHRPRPAAGLHDRKEPGT
ncbi:hypothetical protein HBB16_07055 [Pseudonocardia sp. MCCB 268]|nr:hypothetical protein [Pseudonocardia cytotoxica]